MFCSQSWQEQSLLLQCTFVHTLREAALESGYIRAEEFDSVVVPVHMVGIPHKDLEETRTVFE